MKITLKLESGEEIPAHLTLKKQHQKQLLLGVVEKNKGKRWRAEKDDDYWVFCHDGSYDRLTEDNDDSDNYRYHTGNYFKTKEEAEEYREYIEAKAVIDEKRRELNEGWKPNWEDDGESKYGIYYSYDEGCFCTIYDTCNSSCSLFGYYKTRVEASIMIDQYKKELDIVRKWHEKNN